MSIHICRDLDTTLSRSFLLPVLLFYSQFCPTLSFHSIPNIHLLPLLLSSKLFEFTRVLLRANIDTDPFGNSFPISIWVYRTLYIFPVASWRVFHPRQLWLWLFSLSLVVLSICERYYSWLLYCTSCLEIRVASHSPTECSEVLDSKIYKLYSWMTRLLVRFTLCACEWWCFHRSRRNSPELLLLWCFDSIVWGMGRDAWIHSIRIALCLVCYAHLPTLV